MRDNLDEIVDWFARHGMAHVKDEQMDEFGRRVGAMGLGYIAAWDNGLKCYYVEKQEAVDLGEVQ